QLRKLLRRPRRRDLSFRPLHVYCFDNTWKLAVAEFVESADVVLMDLRGYSGQRKGCEYEVDFLLDSKPINRIVFLVDHGSGDLNALHELVRERWEHLKVNSPNLSVSDPLVTIYATSDQRADDVKGLLDVLFARAQPASSTRRLAEGPGIESAVSRALTA